MTAPAFDPRVRDLAQNIYRDLVSKALQVSATHAEMKSDPVNLAKIAFKLSATFFAAEDELNAANLPKNQDFKVGLDDLAAWTK